MFQIQLTSITATLTTTTTTFQIQMATTTTTMTTTITTFQIQELLKKELNLRKVEMRVGKHTVFHLSCHTCRQACTRTYYHGSKRDTTFMPYSLVCSNRFPNGAIGVTPPVRYRPGGEYL